MKRWFRGADAVVRLAERIDGLSARIERPAELVVDEPAQGDAIPPTIEAAFDFCRSSCSLEHLGSLAHGLEFVKNSLRTPKPGSVAVHTTEYNLSANEATIERRDLCVYRRRDIEAFCAALAAEGHTNGEVDFEPGRGYAETVVDLPPFARGEPHLRLGEFDGASLGLAIEKSGAVSP